MRTMPVELYDALRAAGASEQKARAAAESLVIGPGRLERIEQQTGQLPSAAAKRIHLEAGSSRRRRRRHATS